MGLITAFRVFGLVILLVLASCNSSASSSHPATPLAIGDAYEGGFIFEVNGDGVSGRICAVSDNSTGIEWGTLGVLVGPAAQSATDGAANTLAIVASEGAGTDYAAGLCDAYEIDSLGNAPCQVGNTCFDDWYLPSYQEMGRLFQQSTQMTAQSPSHGGPITGIEAENYSTSSEIDLNVAFVTDGASLGNGIVVSKDSLSKVRCIRQFGN